MKVVHNDRILRRVENNISSLSIIFNLGSKYHHPIKELEQNNKNKVAHGLSV